MELNCTLSIGTWLNLNIHFDCRYPELRNNMYMLISLCFLNVRDGSESKYPSFVFLVIFSCILYVECFLIHTYRQIKSKGVWRRI